jgi:hypothetical protein
MIKTEIMLDMIESTKKRPSNTIKKDEKQIVKRTSITPILPGMIKFLN